MTPGQEASPAAEQRQPKNIVAMLMSVVPGLAQAYLDHVLLGAILFACFLTALNGLFLSLNLQSTNTDLIFRISVVALVLLVVGSMWHAYAQSYGTDRQTLAQGRRSLLREALLHYLRDELEIAALKLEQAIDLDVDWQDPDPLFHLGVVMLRVAERRSHTQDLDGARAARRRSQWAFRTCLSRDSFGKWTREIRRETRRMRRLLDITGRLRKSSETSERQEAPTSSQSAPSFPELRESGSLPRIEVDAKPIEGMPHTRVTPRPFSRARLAERLAEADALAAAETVAMEHPPSQEETTQVENRAWPTTRRSDRFLAGVLRDSRRARRPRADDPEATRPERRGLHDEPTVADEPPPHRPPPTRQTSRLGSTRRLADEVAAEPLPEPTAAPKPTPATPEPDLPETRKGTREVELPGEEASAPATDTETALEPELPETRKGAREGELPGEREPRPPEHGMPPTRLNVRPKELMGDLLIPSTRQEKRQIPAAHAASEPPPPEGAMPATRLDVDPRALIGDLLAAKGAPADPGAKAPEHRPPTTRPSLVHRELAATPEDRQPRRDAPTQRASAPDCAEDLGWESGAAESGAAESGAAESGAVAAEAEGSGAAEAVLLSAEAQRRRDAEGSRSGQERDSDSDLDSDSEMAPRSHGTISAVSAISALSTNAVADPHELGLGTRSRESLESESEPVSETADPRADGSAAIAAGAAQALDISAEIAETAEIARGERGRVSAAGSEFAAETTGTGTGTGTDSESESESESGTGTGTGTDSDSGSGSSDATGSGTLPPRRKQA
ncbi:MAG: hypothetical protein AB7N76_08350 [Planctomycetota bacterium]